MRRRSARARRRSRQSRRARSQDHLRTAALQQRSQQGEHPRGSGDADRRPRCLVGARARAVQARSCGFEGILCVRAEGCSDQGALDLFSAGLSAAGCTSSRQGVCTCVRAIVATASRRGSWTFAVAAGACPVVMLLSGPGVVVVGTGVLRAGPGLRRCLVLLLLVCLLVSSRTPPGVWPSLWG